MSTTAEKLTYLNETKGKIKDSINLTGANIENNDTFRSYAVKLRDGLVNVLNNGTIVLYNNFPKVSGTGSNISLTNTLEAPMFMNKFDGDTLQDGTPTPSTPVEIQSVEGIQNISVYGKNLFDKNTITSGKLVSRDNGNLENSSDYGASDYIPMEENTTYTLDSNTFNRWYSACYDKNKNYIGYISNSNTFTTIANTKYMRFTVYLNKVDEAMIVKGNTLPTTYEAYTGNTYEVNLEGKNLFDKELLLDTSNYTRASQYFYYYKLDNRFKTNITVSMSLIGTNQNLVFGFTNQTLNFYGDFRSLDNGTLNTTKTFNFTNATDVYFFVGNSNNINIERDTQLIYNNYNIQVEQGSTATPYTPYRSPIKLYNGDYITGTPDNWSIYRENGRVILNENNEWGVQSYGGNTYISGWYQHYFDNASTNASTITVLSDYFKTVSWNNRTQNIPNSMYINLSDLTRPRLEIRNSQWTSVSDLQTWLSTHNTKVVYKLATPTTEQITDTYLISQLNALYNAKSYNGQTNISVDGQLPMILEVSALKDEI